MGLASPKHNLFTYYNIYFLYIKYPDVKELNKNDKKTGDRVKNAAVFIEATQMDGIRNKYTIARDSTGR